MPENPYIPPIGLPGPGERVRYAGQSAGSPMVETGPVTTQPPHATAESNPIRLPGKETRGYWPRLIVTSGETTTFEVTVTLSYVVERIVTTGDALAYHVADNHFDPSEPTLKKFAIEVGQSVYIQVEVLPSGAIGTEEEGTEEDPAPPIVTIVVLAAGQESTHYEPPIGDGNDGAPGTYYYELAELISDSFGVRLKYKMAGRIIDHWIDLPTFETAAGLDLWKEWDADAGVYRTRGPQGVRQILAEQTADTIDIGGNKKNLEVRFIEEGASGPGTGETINFEDGLSTDGVVDASPATERDIILPIVTAGDGITVTRMGAKNREFRVEADGGTGWWGTMQWVYYPAGGGSPEYMNQHFENGRLVRVDHYAQGTDVPGTEGAPGSVNLTWIDTDT